MKKLNIMEVISAAYNKEIEGLVDKYNTQLEYTAVYKRKTGEVEEEYSVSLKERKVCEDKIKELEKEMDKYLDNFFKLKEFLDSTKRGKELYNSYVAKRMANGDSFKMYRQNKE